tara:strand:+ start:231 stop:389 length:159 start_codon:yes stop_codon:yes gene_type:complete
MSLRVLLERGKSANFSLSLFPFAREKKMADKTLNKSRKNSSKIRNVPQKKRD